MMKLITDPTFRYTPASVHLDGSDYLRAKFRKMIREIDQTRRQEAEQRAKDDQEAAGKVKQMKAKR